MFAEKCNAVTYNGDADERDKQVGSRIKQARKSVKLTQKLLAEKVGVTRETLASYEGGAQAVPLKRLRVIAETTGSRMGWLLGEAPTDIDAILKRTKEVHERVQALMAEGKVEEAHEVIDAQLRAAEHDEEVFARVGRRLEARRRLSERILEDSERLARDDVFTDEETGAQTDGRAVQADQRSAAGSGERPEDDRDRAGHPAGPDDAGAGQAAHRHESERGPAAQQRDAGPRGDHGPGRDIRQYRDDLEDTRHGPRGSEDARRGPGEASAGGLTVEALREELAPVILGIEKLRGELLLYQRFGLTLDQLTRIMAATLPERPPKRLAQIVSLEEWRTLRAAVIEAAEGAG